MQAISEDTARAAETILKSITIPAQPQIVLDLMKLSGQANNVDIRQIAAKVQKDPSLAAKILKIVNSPVFGLRRPVDSIAQALSLMGFQLFQRAVLASALRDAVGAGGDAGAQAFWVHSEITARCREIVARKLRSDLTSQAYLAGLFHDCAIPIMRKKFPDYDKLIARYLHYSSIVVKDEDEAYKTNHCVMGYFFTRSWHLPEPVRLAILRHHDDEPQYEDSGEARALTAILKVSEYIVQDYDTSGSIKTLLPEKWIEVNSDSVDILGIMPQDVQEFEDQLLEAINRH